MADVGTAEVGRERGQLILLTGLLVAIAMVAMVLLLNTAIYTENLASRGVDQSGREAVEYRATVEDAVGGLIDEENDREHPNWDSVNASVTGGIGALDNATARSYASSGTVVRINQSASSMTVTEGKLVRQTTSREFQNASDELDDWRLASGVDDDEIRSFQLTVAQSSLEPDVDDGFTVYLEETASATTWEAFVYEDGGAVTVATSIDGGSRTDVCSVTASEATIDLTRGTIDGEPCPGLNWSEGLTSDYDVEYHNGENATGTYNVTLDDSASIVFTNIDSSPSNTVYHVPAVYSVSFEISYETPTLTYRTEVRVAPGEPK